MCSTLLRILPSHAEKRISLVIGNSAYQHVGRLPNPANDAAAMAALFNAAAISQNAAMPPLLVDLRDAEAEARACEAGDPNLSSAAEKTSSLD